MFAESKSKMITSVTRTGAEQEHGQQGGEDSRALEAWLPSPATFTSITLPLSREPASPPGPGDSKTLLTSPASKTLLPSPSLGLAMYNLTWIIISEC